MSRSPSSERSTPQNGHTSPTRSTTARGRQFHYAPVVPSQLRQAQFPPPTPLSAPAQDPSQEAAHQDYFSMPTIDGDRPAADSGLNALPKPSPEEAGKTNDEDDNDNDEQHRPDQIQSHASWAKASGYSPGHTTPVNYGSITGGTQSPSSYPGDDSDVGEPSNPGMFTQLLQDRILRVRRTRVNTTDWIVKTTRGPSLRRIQWNYYLPVLKWVPQYKWAYVTGDLIAALTMASFYIPMSLSLAANLAHMPPINGLYSFVINPLIYAMLGTCPQMIVGPEAAGSLLTGSVITDNIKQGHVRDSDGYLQAHIGGVVTALAGTFLFIAGSARLGFLDNVLSRPFLRGFISAIGFVILVDQLIPEAGLSQLAAGSGEAHGSCVEKFTFLVHNFKYAHGLTCAVSFGSLAVIMFCRETKKRLQPHYPKVAYVPDRCLIVIVATILSWKLRWDLKGVAILGDVRSTTGRPFPVQFPIDFSHLKHVESALSTAFVISLLGFFESSVAAKSLGTGPADGIQDIMLSANRELMALGAANIVGGTFMALPAFGGYGRSKVNASTGGKTPMSGIFLSLITLLCVFFLLPAFYYIPRGVLSAMISVVAYSLIEEAPHDIHFFWVIRGWSELFLMLIVFISTILYSLPLGIACGIGFSLLRVIKHATRPRIQILGRVHGTTDKFENAEAHPELLEFIEGCLIVKIPEPLTFANTGDLRNRLRRLEVYAKNTAPTSIPQVQRKSEEKNIIFDVHGVTSLDGAGAQVLAEIVQSYKAKAVSVFFCRVQTRSNVYRLFEKSGIVETCGGPQHFVRSVQEALALTETETIDGRYTDEVREEGNVAAS